MDIAKLIRNPRLLDRETLYDLRSTLALYPYFQTARLLLLQNLYLLHDPAFNQELRQAALYVTDRRVLFNLVEAAHYKPSKAEMAEAQGQEVRQPQKQDAGDRTLALIDDFLKTVPQDEPKPEPEKHHRKPTAADAAVDYIAYLLETEDEAPAATAPMKGQELIDDFIEQDTGKIRLSDDPQLKPETPADEGEGGDGSEAYFTETLAGIYVRQQRYSKALEIMQRLHERPGATTPYYADQCRFLEKLIANEKAAPPDK